MTQREFFTMVIEGTVVTKDETEIALVITDENGNLTINPAAVEFARERIAALDKANAKRANGNSTAAKESAERKTTILNAMAEGEIYTAKTIAETCGLTSTNQASGLLGSMAKEGTVTVEEYTPTGKKKDMVKGYRKVVA